MTEAGAGPWTRSRDAGGFLEIGKDLGLLFDILPLGRGGRPKAVATLVKHCDMTFDRLLEPSKRGTQENHRTGRIFDAKPAPPEMEATTQNSNSFRQLVRLGVPLGEGACPVRVRKVTRAPVHPGQT